MIGLLAEIPIVSPVFRTILGAIGWVLAEIYDVVGNYGVAIIILTIIVRLILLPLGIKQVRSMHNMQSLQPKIKQLQQKYKGNKQRQQEEVMKLYRESGVNPLSGCWPVLLQFPILIAMYAVLRPPTYEIPPDGGEPVPVIDGEIHIPEDSELYQVTVVDHEGTEFLFMNMQCNALQAGSGDVQLKTTDDKDTGLTIDCGEGVLAKAPYFLLLLLMIGSTFYQQRQMQRAAPPGATNSQQQALLKLMPILFGVFGIGFPSGLVLYWTTSNLWQMGQQAAMLRLGHIGPAAQAAPPKKPKDGARKGIMGRMMDSVDQQRQRGEAPEKGPGSGSSPSKKAQSSGSSTNNKKKPGASGGTKGSGSSGAKKPSGQKPGTGGSGGGSRKKRPKR
ncbi:MAG: YidC/Oxa1 family membrane protein insertase [Actinomycetota bacterium]